MTKIYAEYNPCTNVKIEFLFQEDSSPHESSLKERYYTNACYRKAKACKDPTCYQ